MTALYRSVVRAQGKPGRVNEAVAYLRKRIETLSVGHNAGDVLTVSLFQWDQLLIVYWESVDRLLSAETLFGERFDLLEAWPGMAQPRAFVPMMDIFHCQEPRRAGNLSTANTPDHWHDVMFPHFILWDDAPPG